MYGRISVRMMWPMEWPDNLERLTWSRLRSEITCDRTALAVHTHDVRPITTAMVKAPR